MAYLTPGTLPAANRCGVLIYPDSDEFAAIVRGALQELTYSWNFVAQGALTPDQTAEAFVPMFDAFCYKQGNCRVIGEIVTYAGLASPDPNWLLCDGSSLLRSAYPDLFTVIGTTYGAVDGSHFNLPDLQGRAAIGQGSGSGLSPRAVGDQGGEEAHVLTIGELAAHVHSTGNSAILGTSAPPPLDALGPNPFPAATGSTGNDDPHNNMQPFLTISYLIVALNG